MNAIEKLKKYIKDEGITQISGGIFEDQTRKRLIDEDEEAGELIYESYQVKANTTVEAYCESMGLITADLSMGYHRNKEPVSAEEYAKELLAFMTAPSESIVGECKKCFALLTQKQKDVHECDGKGAMSHEEWMESFKNEEVEPFTKKEGDTSGKLREVESVEEVGELARESGKRLKRIFSEGTQEEWLDELNEISIDLDISKGKAESFKFNDSSKK